MKAATVLLAALLIGPAAQALAQQAAIDLPRGRIVVTHTDYSAYFSAGPQQVVFDADRMPDLITTWGESALVFLASGGNACPGLFAWLTLDPAGLHATEAFGTCAEHAELQMTARGPMAVMPRHDGGKAGYVFDGRTVEEVALGLDRSGIATPSVAAAWAGRSAFEVLTSAEMEPALLAIMPWQELQEARVSSSLTSEGMVRDGEWFVAAGCQPHLCNENAAGVALSTRDGRPIVALWERGRGGQIFGTPDSPLPNRFRTLLANGQ